MASLFSSPGVYTREKDESFLARGASAIGPIIIGETEKGPAFVPIEVANFSEYRQIFGGYNDDSYVPYAAASTLRNSDQLTIMRVLGVDGYTGNGCLLIRSGSGTTLYNGSSSIYAIIRPTSGNADTSWRAYINSCSYAGTDGVYGQQSLSQFVLQVTGSFGEKIYHSLSLFESSTNYIGNILGTSPLGSERAYVDKIFNWVISGSNYTLATGSSTFFASTQGFNDFTMPYSNASTPAIKSQKYGSSPSQKQYNLFILHTLSDGDETNRLIKIEIRDIKPSPNSDIDPYGTFTVVVRDFNDSDKRPILLESWTNVNLDPSSPNYIARRIGDKYPYYDATNNQLTFPGEFDNISNYIRVEMYDLSSVPLDALPFGFSTYPQISGSIPAVPFATGFEINGQYSNKGIPGVDLSQTGVEYLFDAQPDITLTSNGQSEFYLGNCSASVSGGAPYTGGIDLTSTTPLAMRKFLVVPAGGFSSVDLTKTPYSYDSFGQLPCVNVGDAGYNAFKRALNIISNPEAVECDIIVLPGLIYNSHAPVFSYVENILEDRNNDAIVIFDPVVQGTYDVDSVTDAISSLDNNRFAAYWPWIKVFNADDNKWVWKPASTELVGVYKFNDKVAFPWYAPAGLNRGLLNNVKEAEFKLKEDQRNDLYLGRINPLATFKPYGVAVWGQKNTQIAESLMNRVNIVRLLITAQKAIIAIARNLLFDPNDAKNRNKFLSLVNPFLDNIKQNRGLYEFKVICDETNNTPDLVDRNIMYGQIYLKPTTSTEAILLDFSISRSGVSFSA